MFHYLGCFIIKDFEAMPKLTKKVWWWLVRSAMGTVGKQLHMCPNCHPWLKNERKLRKGEKKSIGVYLLSSKNSPNMFPPLFTVPYQFCFCIFISAPEISLSLSELLHIPPGLIQGPISMKPFLMIFSTHWAPYDFGHVNYKFTI